MPVNSVAIGSVCVAGIGFAAYEIRKGWTMWRLAERGLSASATILTVQTVAQPKGGPVQRLEVVFRTDSGGQYRRWLVASTDADEGEHVVGNEIGVRYDARRPDCCVLDSVLAAPWWESPLYRGLLLLGVFTYFLWQTVQDLRTG